MCGAASADSIVENQNLNTVQSAAGGESAPNANFTANTTNVTRTNPVQFTDQSTNNPTLWKWEYKNDSSGWTEFSTTQNPSYTFDTAGTYDIRLNVSNGGGSDEEVKTGYITVHPNCDLRISGMVTMRPDSGAGAVFAGESNTVRIVNVRNDGLDTSPATVIYLYASDVSSTVPVGMVNVPSLASGATINLEVVDPTIRPITANTVYGSSGVTSITYTAKIDPDNAIPETNEDNNVKVSAAKSVYYNGYKGKRYEYNGTDINTQHVYDLHGNIVYYTGSAYRGVGWSNRTETWTTANLPVPSTGTVQDVWLYVPYNWDHTEDGDPNWTITFNGNNITNNYLSWYLDQSNFGTFPNYKYGLLVYNVTHMFNSKGDNNLVMTALPGNLVAIYPSTLAVIYSDPNATRKQIFINEQCDELGLSGSSYGTTLEEATAYAPFTGMTIDLANVYSATLHSFAGSAGPDEGNLLFNNNTMALDAWKGSSNTASALITNVKNYLTSTGNVAAIQGTSSGGMDAIQQFLVVEYADETPIANFTANTTSGTVPFTVHFSDASTGYVANYAWDFNNDGVVDSTNKNPTWTYGTPGTYTVKLVVSNSAGNDAEIKTGYITSKYAIDKTAPKISSIYPKKYARSVSRTNTIKIRFSENIKASVNWSKVYVKNLRTGKKVKISKLIKNNMLYIKTSKRSAYTWYQIYIPAYAVKDSAGNKLTRGYTWKFKTGRK